MLGGCGGDDVADSTSAAADSSGAPLKKKEKAIKVNVAEVKRGALVMPVHADGTIRTTRSVDVRTKVSGELMDVLVRDGDRVRLMETAWPEAMTWQDGVE